MSKGAGGCGGASRSLGTYRELEGAGAAEKSCGELGELGEVDDSCGESCGKLGEWRDLNIWGGWCSRQGAVRKLRGRGYITIFFYLFNMRISYRRTII